MEDSFSELLRISEKYKKDAKIFLREKELIEHLGNFGRVEINGSYLYGLMMSGDIDLYVVRDNPFSAEEMAEIFKFLYLKRKFRGYFALGDWYDRRKGNEWPHGHYIGVKDKLNDEKWVVDIWFVSEEEFKTREEKNIIKNNPPDEEQKQLILLFKKHRKDSNLRISGQTIYESVINEKCKNLADFEKYLALKENG